MQAAVLNGHGGNEVVAVSERPRPQRRPGEILVRMKAATVNRVDLYMRDSGAGISHRLPQIMGVDGAGVVEEADSGALLRFIQASSAGVANSASEANRCCAPK
jgi:NADPH:quinone reductase-like Zn-dependent oxidoreductase